MRKKNYSYSTIQLKVISLFFTKEIVNLSQWIKKSKYSRGYVWREIYKLEEEKILQRIATNKASSIKYKRTFDPENILDELGLINITKEA